MMLELGAFFGFVLSLGSFPLLRLILATTRTVHRWVAEENLVILDLDHSLDNHFQKG